MWRAARASGAAPSFFRPEGNYIDGGIMANNPSLDLLTEIAEYNIASRATGHLDDIVEPTVLLSLGESFFICLSHITTTFRWSTCILVYFSWLLDHVIYLKLEGK